MVASKASTVVIDSGAAAPTNIGQLRLGASGLASSEYEKGVFAFGRRVCGSVGGVTEVELQDSKSQGRGCFERN